MSSTTPAINLAIGGDHEGVHASAGDVFYREVVAILLNSKLARLRLINELTEAQRSIITIAPAEQFMVDGEGETVSKPAVNLCNLLCELREANDGWLF